MYLRAEFRLERDNRYRQRLMRCYLLSLTLVAITAFVTPPSCVPPALRPEKFARIGENNDAEFLIASAFTLAEQERFISRRIAEGAMVFVDFTIEDEIEEGPDAGGRPVVKIGEITPFQRPKTTEELPDSPPPEVDLEFELTSDFSIVNTSRESSQSSEFGILELFRPNYPARSIYNDIEGIILLRVLVNPNGEVTRVETIENDTDNHCETAAREALREWIFKPILHEGRPIWFRVVVPFQFEIDET